jgi:hypothetical protein
MKREYPTIRLNIGDASNKSDQLVLYFNENATREFDYNGDAYFLRSQNENAFSFYGKEGQSIASIISRKENQKDSVEIFYENPLSQSHFKIEADLSKAEQMNNVYLKDKTTGYIYNLENGETLAFAHKSNSTSPRFILYYSNNPTDFKGLVAQANSSIVAFIKDDQLTIKSSNFSGSAEINVTDMAGRTMLDQQVYLTDNELKTIHVRSTNQIVLVTIKTNQNVFIYRIMH